MSDSLNHYLTAWSLSNPQLLATTATSHVYTVIHHDETVVLKLLTPVGVRDESCGATALRHFDGHGAVRLLRHDDTAHLLEYAAGDDLLPLVEQGDDEQATHIIAGVLNQLHTSQTISSGDGLIALWRRFRSLFDKAQHDRAQSHDSIFTRTAVVADMLLTNQRDVCVLHGDIHHENIRHSARRGWLAIDPKGLYGERTYDAANTLCNPAAMPALVQDETRLLHHADMLAEQLHIERSRILAYVFAYAGLSASWSLQDGDDARHALRMAALVEPHVE